MVSKCAAERTNLRPWNIWHAYLFLNLIGDFQNFFTPARVCELLEELQVQEQEKGKKQRDQEPQYQKEK